jgi:hypothetical protein
MVIQMDGQGSNHIRQATANGTGCPVILDMGTIGVICSWFRVWITIPHYIQLTGHHPVLRDMHLNGVCHFPF